jgi:hypothetical protein
MKSLTAFLILLPTLALADLGDLKTHPRRDYPRNWEVAQIYNRQGIAVKATYTTSATYFREAEVAEIFRRNGMPVGIWNYFGKLGPTGSDGVLYSQDPRAGSLEMPGATLEFLSGDLGVRSITVGSNSTPTD